VFDEEVQGGRSDTLETVRYEYAILLNASSDYCAQNQPDVKAASSPQIHNSPVGVLGEVFFVG